MANDNAIIQLDFVKSAAYPMELHLVEGISPTDAAVYLALLGLANPMTSRTDEIRIKQIAELAWCSPRTVQNAFPSLIEAGLLTIKHNERRTEDGKKYHEPSQYILHHPRKCKLKTLQYFEVPSDDTGVTQNLHEGVTQELREGDAKSALGVTQNLRGNNSFSSSTVSSLVSKLVGAFISKFPKEMERIAAVSEAVMRLVMDGHSEDDAIKRLDYTAAKQPDDPLAYWYSCVDGQWNIEKPEPKIRVRSNPTSPKKANVSKEKTRDERYSAFYALFPDA